MDISNCIYKCKCQVSFSMMEIYNEDVFDLFEELEKNKQRTKLKIAENKGMRSFEIKQKETFL